MEKVIREHLGWLVVWGKAFRNLFLLCILHPQSDAAAKRGRQRFWRSHWCGVPRRWSRAWAADLPGLASTGQIALSDLCRASAESAGSVFLLRVGALSH